MSKVNVLFIGAHPDDEAETIAALGQWREYFGVRLGVLTITRGEGGGNYLSDVEGDALGELREIEERMALAEADVSELIYLNRLDFFYTASAPLTLQVWGDDALADVTAVIRRTRPEVIVTMNPSPVDGNHGNHQAAARLATESYMRAGDPEFFPEHFVAGLQPWRPLRLLRAGADSARPAGMFANGDGPTGPTAVAAGYRPQRPTDVVFGAWNGTWSRQHDESWNDRLERAMHYFVSQGWDLGPLRHPDPQDIPVCWFTLIDSRAPWYGVNRDDAALAGIFAAPEKSLPLGFQIDLSQTQVDLTAGEPTKLIATISSPVDWSGDVSLVLPDRWQGSPAQELQLNGGHPRELIFDIEPDAAADGFLRAGLRASNTSGAGEVTREFRCQPPQRLRILGQHEAEDFLTWCDQMGMPQLTELVPTRVAVFQSPATQAPHDEAVKPGGIAAAPLAAELSSEDLDRAIRPDFIPITLDGEPIDVAVELEVDLPAGVTARRAAGGLQVVDAPLAPGLANPAGAEHRVTATLPGTNSRASAMLNVMPRLTVHQAGERQDIMDVSTVIEGGNSELTASAQLAWTTDHLLVDINVSAPESGLKVQPGDVRRPRRMDAVEISIDPRGDSTDTSTILNLAIFPASDDPENGNPPRWCRERDAAQHEGETTSPGVAVEAELGEGGSYQLHVSIPWQLLPATVDPQNLGFNILIHHVEAANPTRITRTAWSAFNGVRAEPWRFGRLILAGFQTAEIPEQMPVTPSRFEFNHS